MSKYGNVIDRVYIQNPCNEDWDSMIGNDQVRFCSHCAKDVHNISTMTRREAERLVLKSNGKLCLRYYRNPDGKPVTADHSSRFHQLSRRVSRVAAGAFTVALSMSSTIAAPSPKSQTPASVSTKADKSENKSNVEDGSGVISGTISDPIGDVKANVNVTLVEKASQKVMHITSDENGQYIFDHLRPGDYLVRAFSPLFPFTPANEVALSTGQSVTTDITLKNPEATTIVAVAGGVGIPLPDDLLVLAAAHNDIEGLKVLLDLGSDVNKVDESVESTALYEAVHNNNLKIAKLLLAAGAKVNGIVPSEADSDGNKLPQSPALSGIGTDTTADMVDLLLSAGANIDLKDARGISPIIAAIDSENTDIARKLIDLHVNLNATDSEQKTPLMLASGDGNLEIVEALIAAGADVNLRSEDGETALMMVDDDDKADIAKALLNAKADVNLKDKDGTTALMNAALQDNIGILQILIDASAKIDDVDGEGSTALMIAAKNGSSGAVRLLISAGANINTTDKNGQTGLVLAISNNKDNKNDEVIRLLKAAGAIE